MYTITLLLLAVFVVVIVYHTQSLELLSL
jgi:hypothetical protein